MTRHPLRRILGTSFFVMILTLATMTLAADYPGAFFDMGNGGGGTVATQATGWADLVYALEACAAGSDCAITVASGEQVFHWTAEGPLLALAGADAIVCEAAAPPQAPGGTHVADVTPGVGAHELTP
ncbi:MAG: hypothetical protein K0A98_04085 [Trueperaceae bacterium]|nr:hypothetical protein [Trueperaceae bacterium]